MTEPFPFHRQLWSGIELDEADDCICIRLRREDHEDPVELFIPTRCAATAGTALLEVALGRWHAERVKRRLGYDRICVPALDAVQWAQSTHGDEELPVRVLPASELPIEPGDCDEEGLDQCGL